MVETKSVYHHPREKSDGTSILVMRRWPRGVRKDAVDEWERDLAPGLDLLDDWNKKKIEFPTFRLRYREEMKNQREKIEGLARRARKETITLLCWEDDESKCRRKFLKELIEAAGG